MFLGEKVAAEDKKLEEMRVTTPEDTSSNATDVWTHGETESKECNLVKMKYINQSQSDLNNSPTSFFGEQILAFFFK